MKGACDTHFHVFGPAERYPARDPKLRYKPPLAPLEEYLEWAEKNGFERFVFVQPSAYQRDNACMLDAMHATRHPCRGIVDVDEDAPDSVLAELRKFPAILLGAIGHPDVKPGILEKGILLRTRFELEQYINLRPVKLYDERFCPLKDKKPEDIDFVVVRENNEGLYTGAGCDGSAPGTLPFTAFFAPLVSMPLIEVDPLVCRFSAIGGRSIENSQVPLRSGWPLLVCAASVAAAAKTRSRLFIDRFIDHLRVRRARASCRPRT